MKIISFAAQAIRDNRLTPIDLLEQCLARVDQLEERTRAWVFVDRERARADAVRLTEELKRGIDGGPLHGIPIGVKDLFDVFDWPTAAGSKRWANSYARQDCPAVARLREAGAVLMGKTVTVAYAAFDPPVTKNPWNPDRTPGGSSSGSAAAVACGMCLAALGSQTGGSIQRAAAYHGERLKRYPDDYPPKMTDLLREALATSATDLLATQHHFRELRESVRWLSPVEVDAYLTPATLGPPPDPSTTGSNLFQAP